MNTSTNWSVGILSLLLMACTFQTDLGTADIDESYAESVETFYNNRTERLTEPLGWMRLAGMYWLDEGRQLFGSDPGNDIVFPENYIQPQAGEFVYDGHSVSMLVNDGLHVTVDDEPVKEAVLYSEGEDSKFAVHGSLHWTIIKRDDLTGIRLYNTVNEKVDRFTGFDRYDVDPRFFVNARLVEHREPTTVPVVNVLGQTSDVNSPGRLHFHIDGVPYSLIALEGGDRMFIIVGDETNRDETFQGGRYMYIDYPEAGSDITRIDFNLTYNPPCAFNPFTTCQFPPRENILPLRLTAGEKRPGSDYSAVGK